MNDATSQTVENRMLVLNALYELSNRQPGDEAMSCDAVAEKTGMSIEEVNAILKYWHDKQFVKHSMFYEEQGNVQLLVAGVDHVEQDLSTTSFGSQSTTNINHGNQYGIFTQQSSQRKEGQGGGWIPRLIGWFIGLFK